MKSRTKKNPRKSPGITQRERLSTGVFTPILVTTRGGPGKRQNMRLSPEDWKKITRGIGRKGIVTDQKTGKQYIVWGRDCGSKGCYCDAEVISKGTGKPVKSNGKKPVKKTKRIKVKKAKGLLPSPGMLALAYKPDKRVTGAKRFAPLSATELNNTIKKANRIRAEIIKANKITKSIGASWGVPPVLSHKSNVAILLAWLYAFLGPHSFPVTEAAESLNRSSPAARPKVWKWISITIKPCAVPASILKPKRRK